MCLKLIGAGLPRTATMTQKIALDMLGFSPCYHMANVMGDLDSVPGWLEAFLGQKDWDDIFGGFEATVDWPGAFFYKELMEAYPDAKVLLSVRSGESWERSMGDTIWGTFYGDMLVHDLSTAWGRVDQRWANYITLMKAMREKSGLLAGEFEGTGTGTMAKAMERYNEDVKANVPSERLLVWSPADGWGPLCGFLEVPEPKVPLPHVNDTKGYGLKIVDLAMGALNQWREQQSRADAA